MGAHLEDTVFHDSLRAGGLPHKDTLYLRRFHQAVAEQEGHDKYLHVHRFLLNGVMGMGYDVSDKTRDRDGLSIRSHWQRMGNMSVRRNWEYITDDNLGRYSLRIILNLVHDIAEERTSNAIRDNPEKDPNRIRAYYIWKTKDELLDIIDESCRKAHIRVHGNKRYQLMFGGVPLDEVIDRYFDCFTPGYKIRSSLGENSAIEVGHRITSFEDELSLVAAHFFAEVKLNDRIDNGPNIFPATAEGERIFGIPSLSKRLARLRTDQDTKERYKQEYARFEKNSPHRVIPDDRRAQELFKLFIFYSQAAELFIEGSRFAAENPELVASARRPAIRAAEEALDRFIETNPRHLLAVAIYRDLPRKGRTRSGGAPLPGNDAELIDYLEDKAEEYRRTPQAQQFQSKPGLTGLRVFDGSIAHMVRVEANLGSARRDFRRDPLDNIIRSELMQQLAEDWQPAIKSYRNLSDLRLDTSRTRLEYFPNLYEHMKDIIAEEKR